MKTGIRPLVGKELLGIIRNPQLIASLVLIPVMFFFMGGIAEIGAQKAAEEAKPENILVVFEENTWLTQSIARKLRALGYHVALGGRTSSSGNNTYSVVVIVPPGFTSRLLDFLENRTHNPPSLEAIIRISTISFITMGKIQLAEQVARLVSKTAREAYAAKTGVPLGILSLSLGVNGTVVLRGKTLSLGEAAPLIGSLASSFFVALFVIALAAQYAVLSMAQEKEDKSFETLLSQPIPRTSIGFAKAVGALIVTGIQVALFAASWYYYMSSLASSPPPPGGEEESGAITGNIYQLVASIIGLEGALALLVELLLSAIAAAILGLIVGGLSRDTRSAGAAVGPLWIIVVGVGMAAQMMGVPLSPETGLLGATIVLGPPLALEAAITGDAASIATTIASTAATVAVLAILLAKMLNSEIMITGLSLRARLGWKKKSEHYP